MEKKKSIQHFAIEFFREIKETTLSDLLGFDFQSDTDPRHSNYPDIIYLGKSFYLRIFAHKWINVSWFVLILHCCNNAKLEIFILRAKET